MYKHSNSLTAPTGEEGYSVKSSRFGGFGVTLYAKGEAVAVSYSSSNVSRSVYLGKDILGSVRSSTVDTGTLEDRYEYDAFGKPYLGDLSGAMNLGYTGKPYNTSTGLYDYGFRDYKPQTARFTTVDPIRDGNNWFAYVNNDPVNYIDLWGLEASDARIEFDVFMDFIKQQGVEPTDPAEPYKYEKIADSWNNLPESVRNYSNNSSLFWGAIATNIGNHEGKQKRLPDGYHIAEDKDETGKTGVYVHQDVYDPTKGPIETYYHITKEVGIAPDPGPKSTDDRKPDWCNNNYK